MLTDDFHSLFVYLMEQYCLPPENMLFVENIGEWCREQGVEEPDADKPFRLVAREPGGCTMLIRRDLPDEVMRQRMNALSVRCQTRNVAFDATDRLNSARKKLAWLFLAEYASSLPELREDERLADDWAIKEMERLGFFQS